MCVKFSSLFPPSFCHRIVSSLSLFLGSFLFFSHTLSLSLSLSGRFESGRGSPSRGGVASSRVESSHPTAYHFRGLPFSATTHTGGGGPAPLLCVGAHPSEVALFFAISCFSSPALRLESAGNTDAHRI